MLRLLLLLLTLIALGSSLSYSQNYLDKPYDSRSSFGFFADANFNMHTAEFKGFPGIPSCCPRYETGSGIGYSIGLFYALPVSTKIELLFRAGLFNLNGTLSKEESILLSSNSGEGVNGVFEHEVKSELSSIGLQPLIAYRASDQFRLMAGLRAGSLMTKTFSQKEEIISPDYGVFLPEQSRVRNQFSGDIPEVTSLELAAVLGASYDVPLNSSFTLFLVPEVFYSFGLTEVAKDLKWNVNTFSGGISLRYAPRSIEPPPPPVIPPPPPPLPPPPPPPAVPVLNASIKAVGLDSNNTETNVPILKIEEFLSNRMHPILNYVFFENGSAEIPQRYTRMNDKERTEFSVKQLYNQTTMEVYRQVLNVVGKRMEFYPQAKITLIGCNSDHDAEKGKTDLSQNRADVVKQYLVDVWKIDPERITTISRNLPENPSNPAIEDGIEENRRVEIISNIPQIFEPLIVRDTVREANPPNIRFKSKIESEIGIKSWKIISSQNNNNLRVFEGTGYPPASIDWDIRREEEQAFIPRLTEPLNYRLQVVDNDNKIWESPIQTLPVEQLTVEKKILELIEDKEIDKFSLILFGFGRSDLGPENKEIAQFAKNRIRKSSTVKISGFSDRVGESDFNLRLSQKRAEATAEALGVDPQFAKGFGEAVLLFDNDLPEGRFYCRTVNIEIITPIE